MQFQDFVETSQDMIWQCDAEGQFTYVNRAGQHLLGYSTEELLGRSFLTFQSPENADRDQQVFAKLLQGEAVRGYETTSLTKAGNRVHLMTSASPICDDSGRVVGARGTAFDITEHKRTMLAMQQNEARFSKFVEQAPMAMAVVGMNGDIEFINQRAIRVFGYLPGDIPNMDRWWAQAYPDPVYRAEVIADWMERVARALKGGQDIIGNVYRPTCKDGTVRTVYISGVPVAEKILVVFDDITERRLGEERLRKSEERYRCLVETTDTGYVIIDDRGVVIDANAEYVRLSGHRAIEEILGRSVTEWTATEEQVANASAIAQCVASGAIRNLEVTYVDRAGRRTPVEINATTLETDGKLQILSLCRDITGRKSMEQALWTNEQRYRMISELATDYAFNLGVAANGAVSMDFVSDNFYSLTGRNREDASTVDTWSQFIHPQDLGKVMALLQRLIAQPETAELECRSYIHGGQLRWVNIVATSEWDEHQHRVVGIVGAVKDITDRKRAEERIAAEKERLTVTLRSIGDGVITTDTTGFIDIMNEVAEELTGWTWSEARGKPLAAVFLSVDPQTRAPRADPVAAVLSTGDIVELTSHALLVSRLGADRAIAASGAPIKDAAGASIGVVVVFRDITEKQKLLDAVHRSAKLDSLGVLAGGIAHDFNNLLTGIFGYIDLARSTTTDSEAIEHLDTTLAMMNRARALTLQLLTFAKGGAPIQKSTPLVPFLHETVRFALSGSNVACQFSLPANLHVCCIDKNQIAQVIDNIVINAQQAMPNGGIIDVSACNVSSDDANHLALARGKYVKVSIKDQGIGIPADIMPRIFDPFYTTKTKGHGLGLATSYSIVHRHGGCIDVESAAGQGSTFHVYLPVAQAPAEVGPSAVVSARGSGTVLVVDDEECIRDTLQKMLESLGYFAVCKCDGRDALDYYREETKAGRAIAAMIVDLTIPGGMGGIATVAEFRRMNPTLPVFVASGYAEDSVMQHPGRYGFTASLGKPFTMAELSEMMREHRRHPSDTPPRPQASKLDGN